MTSSSGFETSLKPTASIPDPHRCARKPPCKDVDPAQGRGWVHRLRVLIKDLAIVFLSISAEPPATS